MPLDQPITPEDIAEYEQLERFVDAVRHCTSPSLPWEVIDVLLGVKREGPELDLNSGPSD